MSIFRKTATARRTRLNEADQKQNVAYVLSQLGNVVFSVSTNNRNAMDQVEELVDAIKRNAKDLDSCPDQVLGELFKKSVLSVASEL